MRFGLDGEEKHILKMIAKDFCVSSTRIRQIILRSIELLKENKELLEFKENNTNNPKEIKLKYLNISHRTINILADHNINTVDDLRCRKEEVESFHYIGKYRIKELKKVYKSTVFNLKKIIK